jgi:predicted Zn-dependent protease
MDEAYRLDPDAPYRWIEMAEVAFLAGDTERSSRWAQRVIDEQPSCMYVLKARAIAAHCVEDYGEASLCLGQYLESFPFSSCSASHLAKCRAETGDRQGALEAWRASTSWDPLCACEWRQLAETTMTRVGVELER